MQSSAEPALLGFDLGTTSLKGALYDPAGRCLASESTAYPTIYGDQVGVVEQDPEVWMGALYAVCGKLFQAFEPRRVRALGIVSQVNTHVFVDGRLKPLMNAISWQDQRCERAAQALNGKINPQLRDKAWGKEFTPDASFLMSRAQWLSEHHPQLWEKTRYILSPKDYCLARLTQRVASDSISSIGLVDDNGRYHEDALALIEGLGDRLPPLLPITEILGTVDNPSVPLSCQAVVSTMDAWGSVFGSGVVEHGDAFQVAGTSEILGILSNDRNVTPGVVTFPPQNQRYLHSGPTQLGGEAAQWFSRFIGVELAQVFRLAAQASAGNRNALLFLPHLMGERAPYWDAEAKGAFIGLNATHGIGDMALAVLEGVALAGTVLLEQLERAAGIDVSRIRLSGGAARSDLWSQIKSNTANTPYARLENIDSGTFGAAILAGVAAGVYDNVEQAAETAIAVEREFLPDPGTRNYYDELSELYQLSYRNLIPVNRRISALLRDNRT